MQNFNIKQLVIIKLILLVLLEMAQAQRPSFAGSRLPGLSQKDKYNINYNDNNGSDTDITNRFGKPDDPPALPFGATQKPPASYIPVVFPDSNNLPVSSSTARPATNLVESRFGSVDNVSANANANAISSNSIDGEPSRLPIDAKNDMELVAIINRLPVDKRPFWFINAAAIEAQRNGSFANYAGATPSQRSFFG